MTDRDAIKQALLNLVGASAGFVTIGDRLRMWTDVVPEEQPSLFLREGDEHFPDHGTMMPVKRVFEYEVWIYSRRDVSAANASDGSLPISLGALIGAVETALRPPPVIGRVTLGGMVQHCWIEGIVGKDPGDLDGQGKAKIPIRVLVP